MLQVILNLSNVLRIFYVFGFYVLIRNNHLSLLDHPTFGKGFGTFSIFPLAFWEIVTPGIVFFLLGASSLTLVISPGSWKAKFVWWFSATSIIHFYFMTGHTNYHSFHLLIYISFVFIFFNIEAPFQRTLALHLALAIIGTVYFSSGLWKLLEIKNLIAEGKISNFYLIMINGLAYATAEGSSVSPVCKWLVLSSSFVSSSGWIYTVAVELLGGAIVLWPKFCKVWIPFMIFLHI